MKKAMLKTFQSYSLSLSVKGSHRLLSELQTRFGESPSQDDLASASKFVNSLLDSVEKSTLKGNLVDETMIENWIEVYTKTESLQSHRIQLMLSSSSGVQDSSSEVDSNLDSLQQLQGRSPWSQGGGIPINMLEAIVLDDGEKFQLCNAFDTKSTRPVRFVSTRKTFEDASANPQPPPLWGDSKSRGEMYRQRYWIVHQRITRIMKGLLNAREKTLTAIESLVGSSGTKRVLGLIFQAEEGKWVLEDPKSSIPLDFSQLNFQNIGIGLYTEGCVAIIEGEVKNDRDVLVVSKIGFPPAEPSSITQKSYPSFDFFGKNMDHRIEERIRKFEKENSGNPEEGKFWVLSEIWLDDDQVISNLTTFFKSLYEQHRAFEEELSAGENGNTELSPSTQSLTHVVVLMGNFLSPSNKEKTMTEYISAFEKLADIIGQNSIITDAKFFDSGKRKTANTTSGANLSLDLLHSNAKMRIVIVPGPHDVCSTRDVYPMASISLPIQEAFMKRMIHWLIQNCSSNKSRTGAGNSISKEQASALENDIQFASNPTRIRYCSKQLTFFREDMMNKMRRHSFLKPAESEDGGLAGHLVQSLASQSHLCPLPILFKPIFTHYDHAMRLYPLPDFVIIADQSSRFVVEQEDCKFVSPGSFGVDRTFVSISPLKSQVIQLQL